MTAAVSFGLLNAQQVTAVNLVATMATFVTAATAMLTQLYILNYAEPLATNPGRRPPKRPRRAVGACATGRSHPACTLRKMAAADRVCTDHVHIGDTRAPCGTRREFHRGSLFCPTPVVYPVRLRGSSAARVPFQPGWRRWVRAVWRRPVPGVRTAAARALREPTRMSSFLARVMPV